jgi:hypothetical protein
MPRPALLPALVLLFVFAAQVFAHDPFEITAVGRVTPNEMQFTVTMTRSTGKGLALGLSENFNNFDPKEFATWQPKLELVAPEFFEILSQGKPVPLRNVTVTLTEEEDLEFRLIYAPPAPGRLDITGTLLTKISEGYGVALNITQQLPPSVLCFDVLTRERVSVSSEVQPPPANAPSNTPVDAGTAAGAAPPTAAPRESLFLKFLKLGIKHILEGYDHLLFLAGLLIATRQVKSMLLIVTCFTVAHSITLALAALDIVVIPGHIVEPLIAASIVFVGIENLVTRDEPKGRWALTFAFGLIHGFGFASVLRDLGLGNDGGSIVVPLFAFNVGVELGQLLVAALALPLLLKLRQSERFSRLGVRIASVAIALMGAYWLLERTVLNRG